MSRELNQRNARICCRQSSRVSAHQTTKRMPPMSKKKEVTGWWVKWAHAAAPIRPIPHRRRFTVSTCGLSKQAQQPTQLQRSRQVPRQHAGHSSTKPSSRGAGLHKPLPSLLLRMSRFSRIGRSGHAFQLFETSGRIRCEEGVLPPPHTYGSPPAKPPYRPCVSSTEVSSWCVPVSRRSVESDQPELLEQLPQLVFAELASRFN